LYQAYHQIENISRPEAGNIMYDVVGPICESTDCFRKDVELPESFRGDLIAVRTAGAYGEVMASHYNLRDQVQSVYSE
jgi:diaminopimelate decarboxylase